MVRPLKTLFTVKQTFKAFEMGPGGIATNTIGNSRVIIASSLLMMVIMMMVRPLKTLFTVKQTFKAFEMGPGGIATNTIGKVQS
jgi:hypothetical protein